MAVRNFPSLRKILMGVPALLLKLQDRLGFFKRGQVLALKVLDQRGFHDLGVVHLAKDDWHFAEANLDRGVIATLPGDDLIAAQALPDDDLTTCGRRP